MEEKTQIEIGCMACGTTTIIKCPILDTLKGKKYDDAIERLEDKIYNAKVCYCHIYDEDDDDGFRITAFS